MNTNVDGKLDIDQLKDALMARFEELSRRFNDAKENFDFEAQIVANPLPAFGIALALGALIAMGRKRADQRRGLGGMVVAGIGALAMRMIKDVAMTRLTGVAKSWIDEKSGDSSVRTTPRAAAVEPFLGH